MCGFTDFVMNEGKRKWIAKGRKEGKAEGIAETEAKALEEKKTMARGFRDANVSLDLISAQTGFTVEEIKAL